MNRDEGPVKRFRSDTSGIQRNIVAATRRRTSSFGNGADSIALLLSQIPDKLAPTLCNQAWLGAIVRIVLQVRSRPALRLRDVVNRRQRFIVLLADRWAHRFRQ